MRVTTILRESLRIYSQNAGVLVMSAIIGWFLGLMAALPFALGAFFTSGVAARILDAIGAVVFTAILGGYIVIAAVEAVEGAATVQKVWKRWKERVFDVSGAVIAAIFPIIAGMLASLAAYVGTGSEGLANIIFLASLFITAIFAPLPIIAARERISDAFKELEKIWRHIYIKSLALVMLFTAIYIIVAIPFAPLQGGAGALAIVYLAFLLHWQNLSFALLVKHWELARG